jgi:aminomethyltransferase
MFDVSHMTIIDVLGDESYTFLRMLLANDIAKLEVEGSALYSAMLNTQGGVIDDLIVYKMSDYYRLVVNCGTREKDLSWIVEQAQSYRVQVMERPSLAMLAIQGPKARGKLHELLPKTDILALEALNNFHGRFLVSKDQWFVARTGYTGEDGYEVMLPDDQVEDLWRSLHALNVRPCGLGARDTLRLEAGMNLYGHEMDDNVSPLTANMAWTVAFNDARPFIGSKALVLEKETGIKNKLVGLIMQSRGVMREGYTVRIADSERQGVVTSGTFSPTLGCSIALARVPVETGNQAEVLIRGKEYLVDVVRPCFVKYGEAV